MCAVHLMQFSITRGYDKQENKVARDRPGEAEKDLTIRVFYPQELEFLKDVEPGCMDWMFGQL